MKNKEKIKIAVVIPSLCAGGAERVMSFVAKELDPTIFDTTLIVFGFEKDTVYDLKNTKVVYFDKPRVLSGLVQFFGYIRKSKPDIVFTAIGHLNTIAAYFSLYFRKTTFVVREVNVLSVLKEFKKGKSSLFGFFSKRRFKYIDTVVCQSIDMKNDLMKSNDLNEDKLVVINNPITDSFKVKTRIEENKIPQYITVARLVEQKGHERIIKGLGKLKHDFKYTLIGSGSKKERLVALAKELNIYDKLEFVPFTKKVNEYLAKADVYLQGSYVEGFPNALLESLMVGTPSVAFRAPGGIDEIIIEGTNGYIVDNEDGFINQLNNYHINGVPVPNQVSDSVYSRYNKGIIITQYQNLFKSLVK